MKWRPFDWVYNRKGVHEQGSEQVRVAGRVIFDVLFRAHRAGSMGRADMLPELPRTLIHLGGIVVNTVGDGLLGDLCDGPRVAQISTEGHVWMSGGKIEHLCLTVAFAGGGKRGGGARRGLRGHGEAPSDAR